MLYLLFRNTASDIDLPVHHHQTLGSIGSFWNALTETVFAFKSHFTVLIKALIHSAGMVYSVWLVFLHRSFSFRNTKGTQLLEREKHQYRMRGNVAKHQLMWSGHPKRLHFNSDRFRIAYQYTIVYLKRYNKYYTHKPLYYKRASQEKIVW